jgi:hypothetical protein
MIDYTACLQKLQPNWQGSVWGNTYEGIRPHETESRLIPTKTELDDVWVVIEAEHATELAKAAAVQEREGLIQKKMRDLAEAALITEGKLI